MSLRHCLLATSLMYFIVCGSGCKTESDDKSAAKASESGRCPHEIRQDRCPFCKPEMVAADGFCGEHGVAEALCYQCRPYLKAAFRAKGDWCAEHNAPESQCMTCHPELKEKVRAGEHGASGSHGSDGQSTSEEASGDGGGS